MTMHGIAVAATVVACAAAPAFAQTAAEPRLSLNLGAGVVFAEDPRFDGADLQLLIGTDVRLGPTWDLRIEAGGRVPASRTNVDYTTFYFENPAAPGNTSLMTRVDSTIETTRTTIVDLSILARRYWIGEHAEGALFAGLDFNIARFREIGERPLSRTAPAAFEGYATDDVRAHMVFDFGTELGWRVADRWTLFVYGIAGLQPPPVEERLWQPRAGVMLRRR